MFGLVNANLRELTEAQQTRYNALYCGICRQIRSRASNLSRLVLSFDMTFLALLLESLYEPEETAGSRACSLHPIRPRPWVDSPYVRYAADMNVALAYFKALDDWHDDKNPAARAMAAVLKPHCAAIGQAYPRQYEAISRCIRELSQLEKENCPNPDTVANCFGRLLGELLVAEEDLWASSLREMGIALGRFLYLADAILDYRSDRRKGKYNPFLAMETGEDPARWETYLVLSMARCTEYFESLPLVQDKAILDNILYSGVWTQLRQKQKPKGESS